MTKSKSDSNNKTGSDGVVWIAVVLVIVGAILAVLYVVRMDIKQFLASLKIKLPDIKLPDLKLPDIDLPDVIVPDLKPLGSCENLPQVLQGPCKALTGQSTPGGPGDGGSGLKPVGSCENLPSVLQDPCKKALGLITPSPAFSTSWRDQYNAMNCDQLKVELARLAPLMLRLPPNPEDVLRLGAVNQLLVMKCTVKALPVTNPLTGQPIAELGSCGNLPEPLKSMCLQLKKEA